MLSYFRYLFTVAFVSVLLLQFNNCSQYKQGSEDLLSSSVLDCDDDCVIQNTDNLQIKVNLGGNGAEYSVPYGLTEWNLGGDCNEGGFLFNTIRWELMLNGTKVRDSGMTGMAGANTVHSRCLNGRFLLYINLSSISQDPVNRSGLFTGSGANRASYDLYIEVYGQDSVSGPLYRNPLVGRTRISLLPI